MQRRHIGLALIEALEIIASRATMNSQIRFRVRAIPTRLLQIILTYIARMKRAELITNCTRLHLQRSIRMVRFCFIGTGGIPLPLKSACDGLGIAGLWRSFHRDVQATRAHSRQSSARCEARRHSGRAADPLRASHQPAHRLDDQPRNSRESGAEGRQAH